MRKTLIVLLAMASLTACGPVMDSTDMATIESHRATRHASCVTARQQAETARLAAIKGLSQEQTTMALMADAMARQAEALAGKGDPCSQGMGAFEMETAIAKSRNETIGELGATALRVGGAVGGAVVAADAIKSVAKTAGDHINATDNSTVTVEKTTSNSETTIRTGDESGDVTANGPTVSGTDKSTHETTNEAESSAPSTTTTATESEAAEATE